MQFIIDRLEKHQKLFDKISKNIYLMAIKDGFLAAMPIILFSSIFILLTSVPPLFGVNLPTGLNDWFNKIYNYTMGFVGLYVAGTTAKALTGSMNQRIKGGRFINGTSTMMAAMCGFMLLAIGTTKGGAYIGDYFGTKGILSSFVSAFITVHMYKFCVEKDITIKMPKEVPGAISQNFRDVFPFHSLTENFGNFIGELGGTGATFVVPFIFMFLMKSKQLKAIGKASFIPVMFAVNEPLLFGAPIILNPYFFIPFVLAPVVNVVIGKMFIDLFKMRGFMYVLSWALPGPIGAFLDTNFQPISLVLVILLLVLDTLIYLPFCKAYDASLVAQEDAKDAADDGVAVAVVGTDNSAVEVATDSNDSDSTATTEETVTKDNSEDNSDGSIEGMKLSKQVKVLVLCAGGGTSEQLANALTEGAEKYDVPIVASAGAYGSHHDILPNYDLVVLAPQVRTYYDDLKADTDRLGIQLVATKGQQYIALTRDSKKALDFVMENLKKGKEEAATD